jgi:hypothetical protein
MPDSDRHDVNETRAERIARDLLAEEKRLKRAADVKKLAAEVAKAQRGAWRKDLAIFGALVLSLALLYVILGDRRAINNEREACTRDGVRVDCQAAFPLPTPLDLLER